jgi:hypothetical protein
VSAPKISAIRAQLLAGLHAGLEAADPTGTPTASQHPPGVFGFEPLTVEHLAYQVAAPDTGVRDPVRRQVTRGGTNDRTGGALSDTRFLLQWMWRLRVGAENADYDAAVESEEHVWAALGGIDRSGWVGVPESIRRDTVVVQGEIGTSVLMVTIRLRTRHRYMLGATS